MYGPRQIYAPIGRNPGRSIAGVAQLVTLFPTPQRVHLELSQLKSLCKPVGLRNTEYFTICCVADMSVFQFTAHVINANCSCELHRNSLVTTSIAAPTFKDY